MLTIVRIEYTFDRIEGLKMSRSLDHLHNVYRTVWRGEWFVDLYMGLVSDLLGLSSYRRHRR